MKKRILSLFLALVLCLSLVPAVGATETGQPDSAAAPAAVPEPEAAQTPQEQPAAQDAASLMSGESDSRDVAVFIPIMESSCSSHWNPTIMAFGWPMPWAAPAMRIWGRTPR